MKKTRFYAIVTLLGLVGMLSLSLIPNYSLEITALEPESSSTMALGDIEYLIIAPSLFESELEPLALWKTQKGVGAQIEIVEEIEISYPGYDTQEKIKNCIDYYHSTFGTEFVLLAGDHQDVPTREVYINEGYTGDGNYVGCDSYYSNMNDWDSDGDHIYAEDNDDWNLTADVYVGRLSANDISEMQSLVARIITYESNPPVGDWMETALLAGSMTYFDADYYSPGDNVLDYPEGDGNRFFNYVADQFYDDMTVTLLAEDAGVAAGTSDYPHNGSLTATSLWNGITDGASILGVLGHGNAPGIYRTIWDVDNDGDGLFDWDTEVNSYAPEPDDDDDKHSEVMIYAGSSGYTNPSGMLSMTYLMGCSNGNFTTPGIDSLAEYMLKTVSIGSIGGDRIVWGEDNWTERAYGGWYSEGLAFRFFEQLDTYDQPGKALALAKQDYCEDNATLNMTENTWIDEPKWSEKTVKHFNYFGDPEVHIWTSIPEELEGVWTEFNSTHTLIDVTADSSPVDFASVTLTNDSNMVYWEGITNSSGQIMIPYDWETVNSSMLVAYKPEYLPLLSEPYVYPTPDIPVLAEISPLIDRDGTIKLDWNSIADSTSYNVYRESSAITDVSGKTPIANPTNSEYTDRGLDDGIYYYAITAVGIYGQSDPSNCLFVTVEHRQIPGFSIAMISIASFVGVIVIASLVANRIKLRK